MAEELSEQKFAHYLLLERIGTGGLGEVYRARDTRHGRTVALKVLPHAFADDQARRERFMQDARAAAALSHPAIAMLFEVGDVEGRPFLAFEFVPGEPLRRVVGQGPLHLRRAVPIAIQIADALAEAHARGIIHRDLTPDNIIVTPKGAAKILDFGLAAWTAGGRARESGLTATETAPEVVAGTIAYMSPEQALAQPFDARTDIFSFGVVLYEMLTGRNPFAGPDVSATVVNILKARPEPPSKLNPEVPEALDPLVLRMLTRDVESRPASSAVASELRAAFGDRTEHVFEPDLEDVRPPRGGRRGLWLLLVLLIVIAATAAIVYANGDVIRGWWRQRFGTPPAPVVAVIPLREAGGKESHFADGLTDDVIMRLGQTAGVRVLARSATRSYRSLAPPQVARQSGAAVVLTGDVRREDGEMRIDLELIDPDGVQIWRREFVNPAGSVIASQAVIAEEVAKALRLQLAPSALRERAMARSVSPEAYEVYTQARAALATRDLPAAVTLFEKAAALDGGLAEAHAGLAHAVYLRAAFEGRPLEHKMHARVRQSAERATLLEPDLAVVEMANGLAATAFRDALRHFARAATLDPSFAEAYHDMAAEIVHVDTERAVKLYERSRQLDAYLIANYPDLLAAYAMLRQDRQSLGLVNDLERRMPGHPDVPLLRAVQTVRARGPWGAVDPLRKAAARGDLPAGNQLMLARYLVALGRPEEALAALDSILRRFPDHCEALAIKSGVLRDMRREADARLIATFLGGSAPPSCAAVAAAAAGDAKATSEALRRIASEELALRSWMQMHAGASAERAFRERLYPWNKVAGAPEVVAARKEMTAAFARLKKIADEELKVLPEGTAAGS